MHYRSLLTLATLACLSLHAGVDDDNAMALAIIVWRLDHTLAQLKNVNENKQLTKDQKRLSFYLGENKNPGNFASVEELEAIIAQHKKTALKLISMPKINIELADNMGKTVKKMCENSTFPEVKNLLETYNKNRQIYKASLLSNIRNGNKLPKEIVLEICTFIAQQDAVSPL
ncbi:MAG: hypothetical protein WC707_05070 [Candidatus Babeliaceae bacterium]|jgi:hypothetical protein